MRIRFDSFQQHFGPDGMGQRAYRRVADEPSWVTKLAIVAGAAVVVVPLVLLALAAVVVGLLVFFVLSAGWRISRTVRGWTSGEDGRKNVRVMRPGEDRSW